MTLKNKYYFIYKTTCILNNKYYLGRHTTNNLNDGYMGSGKILKAAIIKYGDHNFVREIIFFATSREDLIQTEIELVNVELLKDKLCMNITLGGHGDWYHQNSNSEIQKRKNKKSIIKQKFLMENDVEFRLNKQINGAKIFKKLWEEGKIEPLDWTGRKHTKEAIINLKNAKKGYGRGNENSNYNKRWVFNEATKETKHINIDKLEHYLELGWKKGKFTPKKMIPKCLKINTKDILKNKVLKSIIDVSLKGWPVLMAKEIGVSRTYLKSFIKKELPDFFMKCLIENNKYHR